MVGILYSRYLHNPERAKLHLLRAVAILHQGREAELAQEELAGLQISAPAGGEAGGAATSVNSVNHSHGMNSAGGDWG